MYIGMYACVHVGRAALTYGEPHAVSLVSRDSTAAGETAGDVIQLPSRKLGIGRTANHWLDLHFLKLVEL